MKHLETFERNRLVPESGKFDFLGFQVRFLESAWPEVILAGDF